MAATGGHRPSGHVAWPTGECPVCHTRQRLMAATGKIIKHGYRKGNPSGCPGSYQPPQRDPGKPAGGIVVGFRAGDANPTAQGGEPAAE